MTYKEIPNEVIRGFDGKPLKDQKKDSDGEVIYKRFFCPAPTCEIGFTNMSMFQNHCREAHPDDLDMKVPVFAELEEQTASLIILMILNTLNGRIEKIQSILKPNDGMYGTSISRKAFLASTESRLAVKLTEKEYEWLHQTLARKIPQSKEERDSGAEQQTLGSFLFVMNNWNVSEGLKIITERSTENDSRE